MTQTIIIIFSKPTFELKLILMDPECQFVKHETLTSYSLPSIPDHRCHCEGFNITFGTFFTDVK